MNKRLWSLRWRTLTRKRFRLASALEKKAAASAETPTSKIVVTVASALIIAAVTYLASSIDHLRTTRLAFVNKQIEKLYGPLYILTQSNNEAWTYFTGRYFKRRKTIFSEAPLKIPDVDIWRLWITTVFQPLNIKIESAIVNNPQLLMGPGIPPVFQQFITHTESYRPLIETWKPSDKSNEANYVEQEKNVGAFNYPKDIIQCVSVSYQTLQKRKEALENFFNVVAAFSSEPEQPCVCKFEVADTEEKKSGKCREYKEANYVLPKQDAK